MEISLPSRIPRVAAATVRQVTVGASMQWLRFGLGSAISVAALWLVVRRLDWMALRAAIGGARLWPWLLLAVGSYLYGHALRGMRCKYLIQPWAEIGTGKAANIIAAGYASNNLLPARLGEIARAVLLSDQTGVTVPRSISIVIVERVLDAVAILVLLLLSVATAETRSPLGQVSHRVVLIGLACLAALIVAICAPGVTHSSTDRVARLGRGRALDLFLRWTTELASGLALLRRLRRFATVVTLSFAIWIAESGLFFFLLPALGIEPSISVAFVALGITNLGILVPSTPGYIGTFHYFASAALMLFGVAAPVALAYAIVVHLAFFVPVTVWGVSVIAWYAFDRWRSIALARQALAFSTFEADGRLTTVAVVAHESTDNRAFGALLRGIVETFIPWERLSVDEGERARLVDDTTRFVIGEVRALPVRLRVLFAIGLLGFRVVIRLTTGRGFCDLTLARRQRIVAAWAFGRVVAARQLFRVIRSTALLAFWETPAARRILDRPVL